MDGDGARLRPLTLADLIDESFRLYRERLALFAGLAIAVAIPTLLFQVLGGTGTVVASLFSAISNPSSLLTTPVPQSPIAFLQYPLTVFLLPFQTGTLVLAAVLVSLRQPVSLGIVMGQVLRRYFGLWLVNLLLLAASATLLCPPLGIFLLVRLSLTLPALLAERVGAGAAIGRSWRLTERYFWRTLLLLGLVLVVNYAVSLALAPLLFASAALLPGLSSQVRGDLVVVVNGLLGQIILPLYAISITLAYLDLRVRKEAYDLELEAYRLGAAATFRGRQ